MGLGTILINLASICISYYTIAKYSNQSKIVEIDKKGAFLICLSRSIRCDEGLIEGLNLRATKRKRGCQPADDHLATGSNRSPGETCLCFTKSCQASTRRSDNSNCWISNSPSAVAILSSEVTVPGGT
jgi:hypothetical protein